jgi:hypothetical protein
MIEIAEPSDHPTPLANGRFLDRLGKDHASAQADAVCA